MGVFYLFSCWSFAIGNKSVWTGFVSPLLLHWSLYYLTV